MDEIVSKIGRLTIKYDKKEFNFEKKELNQILTNIILILEKDELNRLKHSLILIKSGLIDLMIEYLNLDNVDDKFKKIIAQTIAELAKTESARVYCSKEKLIKPLVKLIKNNDPLVTFQACRAIGNICFDNDVGRMILVKEKGIESLITLLKSLFETSFSSNQVEKSISKLKVIVSGCLFNAINNFEVGQDIAVKDQIIPLIIKFLNFLTSDEEENVLHCFLLLHSLTEFDIGRSHLSQLQIIKALVHLISKDVSEPVLNSILDTLTLLSDDEEVKVTFVQAKLFQALVPFLNKNHFDVSTKKMIFDLIILTLTNDTSMERLFDNSKGFIYQECINWLRGADSKKINAAILIIGNFARNDSNCILMVSNNIHQDLISILKKNSTIKDDLGLQYACLSSLRNLSIPNVNKPKLCETEIISILLKMSVLEAYPVVFKLLGTLRMLTDQNSKVAKEIGNDDKFLNRLVRWCKISEHAGIKGESNRLLASIIKNSKDLNIVKNIVQVSGTQLIVKMISCDHYVMQNEALISLLVIMSSFDKFIEDAIISSNLGQHLHKFFIQLIEPNHDLPTEIVSNALVLIELSISKSSEVFRHLTSNQIQSDLKNISLNDYPELAEKLIHVLSLLEKLPQHN